VKLSIKISRGSGSTGKGGQRLPEGMESPRRNQLIGCMNNNNKNSHSTVVPKSRTIKTEVQPYRSKGKAS
jgi:hypothetical protein